VLVIVCLIVIWLLMWGGFCCIFLDKWRINKLSNKE
jgi:hypothetical protein